MTVRQPPKLNVLYFAPCSLNEGVGGGARLRNMLDTLDACGVDTHLISYEPARRFGVRNRQVNPRLKVTSICVNRSAPKAVKACALLTIFFYGLRHIVNRKIVIAHAPTIVSGFPALVLAKVLRKPLIIDHMDIIDPDTPPFLYRWMLRRSALVFAISRFLEEEVRRMNGAKPVYLPVFVNAEDFKRDMSARTQLREGMGIADCNVVIGYAGSFARIEGVPVLLRAFKRLVARHDHARLVIVGGRNVTGSDDIAGIIGDLGINDRTILVPPQPHHLMPEYLSAFDIACSPKIDCAENRAANPVKIYEYMSMGLPMVISAVGEPASVIENGIDGFLVKPGDEEDLERALDYVITHPDVAKDAGSKARTKIVKSYTQQAFSDTIRKAIEDLSARSGR